MADAVGGYRKYKMSLAYLAIPESKWKKKRKKKRKQERKLMNKTELIIRELPKARLGLI